VTRSTSQLSGGPVSPSTSSPGGARSAGGTRRAQRVRGAMGGGRQPMFAAPC
jgi:hypothetical protein